METTTGTLQDNLLTIPKKKTYSLMSLLIGKKLMNDFFKTMINLLHHKDCNTRGLAALALMEVGKTMTLPQTVFDAWKIAALDDTLTYTHTGTAGCCSKTQIKVMGNYNEKEATYAINEVGAQSIPVTRDVLDEEYFVISGSGAVWIKTDTKEDILPIERGSHVVIPKKAGTQFKNLGKEPLIFLIITSPPYEVVVATGLKFEKKLATGNWS